MALAHHEHFVQHGPVVDEALQHAGRVDVGQAAGAEDQGHLHGRRRRSVKERTTQSRAQDRPTHLVGEGAVRHSGLTN